MSENVEAIAQIVENIRLSGSVLRLDGERILFTASDRMGSNSRSTILATLRARRDDLVAFLVSESSPTRETVLASCGVQGCSGSCYEVSEGVKIHPPLPDPMFFAWREKMFVRRK